MLTARVQQTKIQMHYENKIQRIRNHKKRNIKILLEEEWKRFAIRRLEKGADYAFSIIFQNSSLIKLIKDTGRGFYNAWRKNCRLSYHDFQSVLYEKAWKIIDDYSPHGKWYLYEHLQRGLHQACVDFLRREGLTKDRTSHINAEFHRTTGLSENNQESDLFDLEESVLFSKSIKEVLATLEADELKVFNIFLDSDNIEEVTLDVICHEMGLKHRQQAKRILDRLKVKLSKIE
ncbi:hypothetical protein M670_01012 [Schinkia azotoformans MEV2011]|uniref:Sigma-70 family RNA polymerase sigma factor n=1 Tax=Schinkia azotoformans MEV2011 TaxID=1348973 RepID=A0A072NSY6_SCHAZ|nr:hypothetical protein [Schinkia azotoformans]KEF39988.1 hypothetical protein M670_01012 [Schinkia azotoformans MEV2011]MEC1697286.1 hypothetical protein [Schinkia azotoformans]MEC1724325.1 hypothetical protein [Schinkia azotoformans]MEC1771528.1 hypothetical protein [Schinkia azotoformans]MED4367669.1 hypothetical protein [Schinkia azotoformans]